MPRYFFDFHDGDIAIDEEGVELESTVAAHARAVEYARSVVLEEVSDGRPNSTHVIKVRDESGKSLFEVPLNVVSQAEN